MKKTVWLLSILLTLFLSLPAGAAQGRGKSKKKTVTSGQSSSRSGSGKFDRNYLASQGRAFSDSHVRLIVDWFHNPANLQGLPPGLAKREQLPPGLQRHLERNGTLPPGLQKKIQPIPVDLGRHLPRYADGIRVVFVVGNVLLIETSTSAILDIVKDVVKAF